MTRPWKTWMRSLSPSWTLTVSPGSKLGMSVRDSRDSTNFMISGMVVPRSVQKRASDFTLVRAPVEPPNPTFHSRSAAESPAPLRPARPFSADRDVFLASLARLVPCATCGCFHDDPTEEYPELV